MQQQHHAIPNRREQRGQQYAFVNDAASFAQQSDNLIKAEFSTSIASTALTDVESNEFSPSTLNYQSPHPNLIANSSTAFDLFSSHVPVTLNKMQNVLYEATREQMKRPEEPEGNSNANRIFDSNTLHSYSPSQRHHGMSVDMLNVFASSMDDDEEIQKELAHLPFTNIPTDIPQFSIEPRRDVGECGSSFGALAIDIDPDSSLYLSTPERRRHRTDPGGAEAMFSRLHAQSGTMLIDEDEEPAAKILTDTPSFSRNPLRMRRRSKGKPENVCQLLTSISHKPFFGRRHHSFSARKPSALSPQKRGRGHAADEERHRSMSIAVGETTKQRKTTQPAVLNRFPSQLRSPRVFDGPTMLASGLAPYTPPPILSPMRNGSGLFWQLARAISRLSQEQQLSSPLECSSRTVSDERKSQEIPDSSSPDHLVESEKIATPTRKNGCVYTSSSQIVDQLSGLESLGRKMSSCSTRSTSCIVDTSHGFNIADDCARKMSSVSMDNGALRKLSTLSDSYYDYNPPETDAIPHINLGRQFQAKVRKWADDREVSQRELDAIPDRDETIFEPALIDHVPEEAIEAYESLSCSQAVPRPGRNKELALHLLMENKGNIQAAVMDLLRSDSLDWDQYPIIQGSQYVDTDCWVPDEIASFQDAIYKSEKDFHQVSHDMGNKTVKQCVAFYYTWKKACPDDYRKLRNLRRKRQLLELHQAAASVESYNLRSNRVTSEHGGGSSDSDASSTPSFILDESRVREESRVEKLFRANAAENPLPTAPRKTSMIRFSEPPMQTAMISPSQISAKPTPVHRFPAPHTAGRASIKKGAQPSADGYFHCRLCDKCFEKVKSLNAHMKSHAMKARAEAEAQLQLHYNTTTSAHLLPTSPQLQQHSPLVIPANMR